MYRVVHIWFFLSTVQIQKASLNALSDTTSSRWPDILTLHSLSRSHTHTLSHTQTSLLPVWPGDTLWINKCISGAQTDNFSIPCHCVGSSMPPVGSLIGQRVVLCVWWVAAVGHRFNEAGGRWVIATVTSSDLAEVIITSRVNVWN